jgi:hypothetical protein
VPARLVVVTGGKGGPGATTLAVGLAGALAAEGKGVLLADLDPAGGEVAAHLPAEPHRGLLPLLSLTGSPVSPDQVAAESVTVGEHLWVLPGLPRSEPAGGGVLSPAKARAVALAATRLPELEVVVADAGRLQPGSVAASLVEAADLGVLATRPDYLGAVAARRALDAAPQSPGRLVPVAVGVRRRWLGDLAELEQVLGRPVGGTVPASARGIRRAIETGAPPSGGRLGRSYARLARRLLASPPSATDVPVVAASRDAQPERWLRAVLAARDGSSPAERSGVDGGRGHR